MILVTKDYSMEIIICPWCGGSTRPCFNKGHYECGRCNRPISDCCDGEVAQNSLKNK